MKQRHEGKTRQPVFSRKERWGRVMVPKVPRRREWLPIPVLLPREFQGQRSLAGYSPWGHKE